MGRALPLRLRLGMTPGTGGRPDKRTVGSGRSGSGGIEGRSRRNPRLRGLHHSDDRGVIGDVIAQGPQRSVDAVDGNARLSGCGRQCVPRIRRLLLETA